MNRESATLSQPGVLVHVHVVPEEHNRGTELLAGGDRQVPVIGPGGIATAALLVIDVPLGPEDRA